MKIIDYDRFEMSGKSGRSKGQHSIEKGVKGLRWILIKGAQRTVSVFRSTTSPRIVFGQNSKSNEW